MDKPESQTLRVTDPLSTFSLTCLVAANMIGAGLYTTSGFALADLQTPGRVMIAWVIGGVIALCGAISYGMLAERLTENGGEYLYLSRWVHPAAGSIAGWVSLLAGFTSAGAFAALAFESYALPNELRPEWLPSGCIAVGLVLCMALLHAGRTYRGAFSQNVLVVGKLLLIAVFLIYAFSLRTNWQGITTADTATHQGWSLVLAMATSVMWISLSYSGFNAAIYVAQESRDGGRAVARSMLWATLLVSAIYLLMNAVFVYGPASSAVRGQEQVATIAATAIGGDTLAWCVRIAISLGLASSVSSVLMTGPRVYAKMAEDGVLPRFFASVYAPPLRAVWLQAVAVIVVVLIVGLPDLLSYLGLTLSLSAAATVSTLFWQEKQTRRLVIPGLFVVATLTIGALATWHQPSKAVATLATIGIGLLAYWVTTRKQAF